MVAVGGLIVTSIAVPASGTEPTSTQAVVSSVSAVDAALVTAQADEGAGDGTTASTPAAGSRRNLALNRAVIASSIPANTYDKTGQLVTDGVYRLPGAASVAPVVTASSGTTPENVFDRNLTSNWTSGNNSLPAWVQAVLPAATRISSYVVSAQQNTSSPNLQTTITNYPTAWTIEGSSNGTSWTVLDTRTAQQFTASSSSRTYPLAVAASSYKYYRINISASSSTTATNTGNVALGDVALLDRDGNNMIQAELQSRWDSLNATAPQWVQVDLGAASTFDDVKLVWDSKNPTNYATAYTIQTSVDGQTWATAYTQTAGVGGDATKVEDIAVNVSGARYVKVNFTAGAGARYSLQELQVFGTNDFVYSLPQVPAAQPDGKQYLSGGNWRLQRDTEVSGKGRITDAGRYIDKGLVLSTEAGQAEAENWLPATVPGTVLTSFINAGAVPDPNFADNQMQISDEFFSFSDWWYTDHFIVPTSQEGKRTWLNFDAVNWKARVYFNGHDMGQIDGAFIEGKFDVTKYVNYGQENYVAVKIIKDDHPGTPTHQTLASSGTNGGVLGADNPTIHASIGWDWIPTIRGRNIGIYEDVYLSYSQDVTVENPWVITDLDLENHDLSKAKLTISTELKNATPLAQTVVVNGTIQPGNIPFQSKPITVPASQTIDAQVAVLTLKDPKLWWPNGYGDQPLYTLNLQARDAASLEVSDAKSIKFGVREYSYTTGDPFVISVNGTRITSRGGNWGLDDSNKAATAEDFDRKMKLHADEHLNYVRNWVGQTNAQAFYDAADKYGIMIWDDFWLANPYDGPDPIDQSMFMDNAIAKIKRNRYHASVANYVGRNEGWPRDELKDGLPAIVQKYDGTRWYFPSSSDATYGVTGHGPYQVQDPKWYWDNTPKKPDTNQWPNNGTSYGALSLNSERGMPNVPTVESLQRMLGDQAWPISDVWGVHDFSGGATGQTAYQAYIRNHYDNTFPTYTGTAVNAGAGGLLHD